MSLLQVLLRLIASWIFFKSEKVPGVSSEWSEPILLHAVALMSWLKYRGAATSGKKWNLIKQGAYS